jgi:hypothetical protein
MKINRDAFVKHVHSIEYIFDPFFVLEICKVVAVRAYYGVSWFQNLTLNSIISEFKY